MFDWNVYITGIINQSAERVIAIRPSSGLRKERRNKDKDRNERLIKDKNISFNDTLINAIDKHKDCDEDRPKRLLK